MHKIDANKRQGEKAKWKLHKNTAYYFLNKFWKQHTIKEQLYGHLLPISKTTPKRQTRHAGHFWRSKDKLISNILQWTPTQGHTSVSQPVKINKYQFCMDAGCSLEDLPGVMDKRDWWQEIVREHHAISMTRWW